MSDSKARQLPFRQVIVIGAGIGGIDIACALKRKINFHDFVIYERMSGIGGTWLDNDYPGCAVDIPGFVYQLSYAPETNFSRIFPDRGEMLSYLLRVVDDYGVREHVELNTQWLSSTWLEDRKVWTVELQNVLTGEKFIQECKVLVGAIGHQVDPKDFDVEGSELFEGPIISACKYPENVDLKGKKVLVLGNGSTSVQVVPGIMDDVEKCIQVQRDAQWIFHRPNPRVPEAFRKFLKTFPAFFYLLQQFTFAVVDSFFPVVGRWLPYISKRHLRTCGVPEKYHSLLTPSYTPGCKRVVFTPDYLQSLKNPKFELVQDGIKSVTKNSVILDSGKEYEVDAIILCHGFKADTFYYPLKGRDGITPSQHWDETGGPSCYKGCAMHGFPNFFSLRGPNVSSGHHSLIWFIEATTALVMNVATPLIQGKVDTIEVDKNAELVFAHRVQDACQKGFWGRDCHTFYVTKNGWNHTVYPWSPYWLWFHRFVNKSHWTVKKEQVTKENGLKNGVVSSGNGHAVRHRETIMKSLDPVTM